MSIVDLLFSVFGLNCISAFFKISLSSLLVGTLVYVQVNVLFIFIFCEHLISLYQKLYEIDTNYSSLESKIQYLQNNMLVHNE